MAPDYSVPITAKHPNIVNDVGFTAGNFPFGLVCGCETMEMLCHWFNTDEWVEALHVAGFHIAVYVVPDDEYHRTKSGTQVAFFNYAEYLVETHSVLKLLDIL